MHGLVNRSIQCFVLDTYGAESWNAVVAKSETGITHFEGLLSYEPAVTHALLGAASEVLGSPKEMILEDVGTYLVSHPSMHAIRRLLRFGGETFVEFLFSLDELRDRVRLAASDLGFPTLELRDHSSRNFTLLVTHDQPGFGYVLMGVLRAMADDFGALVFLEHRGGGRDGVEAISIELLDVDYSEGRSFALVST